MSSSPATPPTPSSPAAAGLSGRRRRSSSPVSPSPKVGGGMREPGAGGVGTGGVAGGRAAPSAFLLPSPPSRRARSPMDRPYGTTGGVGGMGGMGGAGGVGGAGEINVDNIFAAAAEEEPGAGLGGALGIGGFKGIGGSDGIFCNFDNFDAAGAPSPGSGPAGVATATSATTAAMGATTTTTTTAAARRTNGQPGRVLNRTASDGLSKSVGGATSFLRPRRSPGDVGGGGEERRASSTDPSSNIRHAGYLLKRSNLPIAGAEGCDSGVMPTAILAPVNDAAVGGIALLPDLGDVGGNDIFSLPFGGIDEGEGAGVAVNVGSDVPLPPLEAPKESAIGENGLDASDGRSNFAPLTAEGALQSMDAPTMTTMEDAGDETTAGLAEDQCFCSPISKYFRKLFRHERPRSVFDEVQYQPTSPPKRRRSPTKTTQPLPITPTQMSPAASYRIPLKAPARSEPVPISPMMNAKKESVATMLRRGSSGGQLSRSLSNGGNLPAAAPLLAVTEAPKPKEYPPPPPDYVDPKDGHIWRAKYCVLEEGILYFYRTAAEGESEEARTERYESRLYDEEGEDIVLGEEVEFRAPPRSPGTTFPITRRSISMQDRPSSKDLSDLSKSPMPVKRSEVFDFAKSPFHRSGSSVLTGYGAGDGRPSTPLRHSSSLSTFNHDSDILWEKRVALDCVGAVRSSEQEHGSHAFELLAYGLDERGEDQSDVSTRASSGGAGGGQKQHEIIDRLILRAGDSDDMNTWMFQFHRSLSSFMQQIVNSVRSGKGIRPDSPRAHHRRLPTPTHIGGSIISPFVTKPQQSFASSPSVATGGNNSFHDSFSPNIVGSLSHGHGRNALYRRQVRERTNTAENNIASCISPLPTPAGTPAGGSSPVDALSTDNGTSVLKRRPIVSNSIMIQSDASKLQEKKNLPSLIGLRGEGKEEKHEPPSAPPKKYIPPHMRRKLAAASGSSGSGGINEGALVGKKSLENHFPLNDNKPFDEEVKKTSFSQDALDKSLSDSALSATSPSSMLGRQLDEEDISAIRLGGCADTTAVQGSIVDHHFIDRKASVVGNERREPYGGTGGGLFASTDKDNLDFDIPKPSARSVLKWEVGASSECGVRNSNEDAYVVINDLEGLIKSQGLVSFSEQDLGQTRQQALCAIFDGHVGNQAARFSAEKFPGILIEEQSSLASRDSACLTSIEERADTVLREAFDRLDREFCSLCTKDGRSWDCGSTALVALIVDNVVSLANLGDCSGVVCRMVSADTSESEDGWESLPSHDHHEDLSWDPSELEENDPRRTSTTKLLWKEVTETHSPLFDEERDRIEKANGWIIKETEIPIGQLHRMDIFDEDVVEIVHRCFADRMKQHRSDPVRQIQIGRTCGDLAVSRAIGDRDFKAAYNIQPSTNSNNDGAVILAKNEEDKELAGSWEGPLVFLYPEGHSGRFKGDIVSNIPDIKFFKIGQEGVINEFLLMACDGLWDVMDGDDAVRIAKNLLFDKKLTAKDGAARLAELAQHLGSSDNITVILVRFYWEECEE